jgi:peptidoglycan/xylan/chitin deacetylase (PgdA/CDA1 family)
MTRSSIGRAALALLCALAAMPVRAGTVALTFDDLPVFGRYAPAAEGTALTATLLGGLRRHHFVATGFVNEIQLAGADRPARIAMLSAWLDAGMDLGNHTYSHLSLTTTPVDAYIADTAKGAIVTGGLLASRGRRERWFRYPFLETGTTAATRQAFTAWLAGHGYQVAPVTMENSDWQFASVYEEALARGDAAGAAHVRQSYLAFTGRVIAWYEAAARQLLGREPAFVFLLHASRLNAASIDQLAVLLRRAHLTVVSLDHAMRDPAYRTADTYVGPDGIEWLERWSLTLHRTLPFASMPAVAPDIVAADARIDAAPAPQAATPH